MLVSIVKHTRRIKCMWSRHKFMWLHIWEILGIDDHLLQRLHLVGGILFGCTTDTFSCAHKKDSFVYNCSELSQMIY